MGSSGGIAPWQHTDSGTYPSPYTYTVPASQEPEVASVTASFDGTGASGNFVMRLQFLSQAGFNLGTVTTNPTTFAPGDTGSVSWFPFVPPASSGGGVQDITSVDESIVVTDPAGPVTDLAVRTWKRASPLLFGQDPSDSDNQVDYSTAFAGPGGSGPLLWLLMNAPYLGPTGGRLGTLLGNAANYVVTDPSAFGPFKWLLPAAGTDTSGGVGPYLAVGAVIGSGIAVQASSSGTVYNFHLVVEPSVLGFPPSNRAYIAMLLDSSAAGDVGGFLDLSTPFTWAVGDFLACYWATTVLGYD